MRRAAALLCAALLLSGGCSPTSEPDPSASPSPLGDDPLRDRQWGLDLLDPERTAWPVTRGEGVTVAVVDSGVDADHPDLAGRVDAGIDLVEPGTPPDDQYGHGTHVAGIIGAEPGNDVGVAGLAPDVRILPVRVLDADGRGTFARTARGIAWAVDHGADVLTLSLTLAKDDRRVRSAVGRAVDRGVVVVAAAGNRSCPPGGVNQTVYPAAYPGVVGVGGVDDTGAVASFSSCGPWVDLLAPGLGIISIVPPQSRRPECRDADGSCLLSGTSEAVPFVAAAAALRLAQLGDSADGRRVATDLVESAADVDPSGPDLRSGHGLLDLEALLDR